MGSARFDDAATLRKERLLDNTNTTLSGNPNTASQDDLDLQIKNKPKSISALLELALQDKDENPHVSIRGVEHFVYPELQQEMIRKKKEVQAQVVNFVKSKKPDPQGWRLANHSRMYSQWARDVAVEKGRAYRMHDVDSEVMLSGSPTSHSSLRTLTSSASFSAASYYESEVAVSPTNASSRGEEVQNNNNEEEGQQQQQQQQQRPSHGLLTRRASDSSAVTAATTSTTICSKGLLKNGGEGYNNLVGTTIHQFQELRVKEGNKEELRMAASDDFQPRAVESQSAGADTDEA